MRRTGPTSEVTRELIAQLRSVGKREQAPAWLAVAEELEGPSRRRAEVNLSRINRYSEEGEMVVVPGAVLGTGKVEKRVTVAALRFTKAAREKLIAAGCSVMTLKEALEKNPKAQRVRIIK
ncbi:MAG: 50S ribosomal protein L18e [Acidilobaceae archaeon]|nr:50S ribosomal protein L18e [Acidilobaceae archaeon]MCX8165807.1 50S ribosomal protein L18e [Acidilobaceae archaeon]MDW7974232.1 50S ribosomal protein L18e [Sulfolobales archaeon]